MPPSPHSISEEQSTAVRRAIGAAVDEAGTPRTPEVQRCLTGIVQGLLDRGASAYAIHGLLAALFAEVRALHEDLAVRGALEVLHTEMRSYALAHERRRPPDDRCEGCAP